MNKSLFDLLPQDIISILLSKFDIEGLMVFLVLNPLNIPPYPPLGLIRTTLKQELQTKSDSCIKYKPFKPNKNPQRLYVLCCKLCQKILQVNDVYDAFILSKILFDKKYVFNPSLRLYHQMQDVGIVDHIKKFILHTSSPIIITPNIINYLRIIISNEVEFKVRVNFDDIYKITSSNGHHIVTPHPGSCHYMARHRADIEKLYDVDQFISNEAYVAVVETMLENLIEKSPKIPQTYYEIDASIVWYLYVFCKLNVLDGIIKRLIECSHTQILITGLFVYNDEVDKIEIDPNNFEAQWQYIREKYYRKF